MIHRFIQNHKNCMNMIFVQKPFTRRSKAAVFDLFSMDKQGILVWVIIHQKNNVSLNEVQRIRIYLITHSILCQCQMCYYDTRIDIIYGISITNYRIWPMQRQIRMTLIPYLANYMVVYSIYYKVNYIKKNIFLKRYLV